MNWLIDAFWARIGWAFGEVAIGLFIFTIIVIVFLLAGTPRFIRQKRCEHKKYYETGSCNAICSSCGKNLGFIGALKK